MAKIRKSYLGGAASTTTSTAIASSGTNTFNIAAYTGWPYGTPPFFVVLEPGTANEEKVLVTRSGATDLTLTVYTVPSVAANRGLDGTSAVAHALGSTTFPVFTATEADEANELVSTMTTKGDLLSHGTSTFARLGVGTDTYVLKADSAQATGLVWGQVAAGGIATDAVTTAKIQDSAVTSAKIADGAIVNADINASAGIVDTKLATISTASKVSNSATTATSGNTASAIVARDASGNFTAGTITATTFVGALTGTADNATTVTDGAITSGKIASSAVTSVKIATGAITPSELATDAVTTSKILNLNVTTGKIALLAVDTGQLASLAVTADKIATNTITSGKIANGAVTSSELGTGAVTGIKVSKSISNFSGPTYTVTTSDCILNHTTNSDVTVTLPSASTYTGRSLQFRNTVAYIIESASNNIVGLQSAGTPRQVLGVNLILSGTDGAWCELVSDGTNWLIVNASELT